MKRLKTLHLTNAFHERSGGIRTTYLALMAQAEREGRPFVLVVPAERSGVEHVGSHGTIYRVRAPRAPAFDRRYRVILPHRFLIEGRGPLWDILARERPDVVEITDKYSLHLLAGLLRRRRTHAGHGPTLVGSSCERLDDNVRAFVTRTAAGRHFARRYLGGAYMGMFDAHVANSNYTAAELHLAMRPPHIRPVHVATPGVHPLPPVPSSARRAARVRVLAQKGVPLSATCLLYAGRLSAEKNLSLLPELIARLVRHVPNTHLLIVGDGPLRARLQQLGDQVAPGRLHFTPHVSERAELCALIAAADLFVHPNPREPFGIGPLEAMSLGVPTLVPAAGGVLSYADDTNAWLAAPDPESMTAVAVAALSNPALRDRRIEAARKTAERFAWPKAASRMLSLYDAIHQERSDVAKSPRIIAGSTSEGRATGLIR